MVTVASAMNVTAQTFIFLLRSASFIFAACALTRDSREPSRQESARRRDPPASTSRRRTPTLYMAEFLPAPALLPSPLSKMAFAEQRAQRVSIERARKARADQEFQRRQTERLEAERARKLYDKQARELIALRREMKERSEPGYGPKRWCWPGALQTSGREHSPFLHASKPDPHVSFLLG